MTVPRTASDLEDMPLLQAFRAVSEDMASADLQFVIKISRFDRAVYSGDLDFSKINEAILKGTIANANGVRSIDSISLKATQASPPVPPPRRGAPPQPGTPSQASLEFQRVLDSPPRLSIVLLNDGELCDSLGVRFMQASARSGLLAPLIASESARSENAAAQALAEQVAVLRDLLVTQARENEVVRLAREKENDARRRTEREELEAEKAKNTAEQAEQAERHRAEQDEATRKIVDREHALEERARLLDLQNERAARRKLREDIQGAAKRMFENPDLSEEAKKTFSRVMTTCKVIIGGATAVLLLAVFAPAVIEHWLAIPQSNGLIALAWSLRAFAGIALAVVLAYFVRSLSAWSRQVTSLELRSKQFALDIDRASWLVEMNLEYEKEGKTLQPALIESFSRGLFEGDQRPAAREQPSSTLLHLIRNMDSLRVGAGGSELSISGSQVRKADAQAHKAT